MSLISGSSVTGSGGAADTGYQISRSLRFNSADSAYLNRTPSGAGTSVRKSTFSFWLKRGIIFTSNSQILTAGVFSSGNKIGGIGINSDSQIYTSGGVYGISTDYNSYAKAQLRDPSAWYHIVVATDTTQATESNRLKIYINGVDQDLEGSFGTPAYEYPSLNFDTAFNAAVIHSIGITNTFLSEPADGLLTEIYMIDGQQLAATDFGEFNSDTGVWQPIEYTGTYGTNGFYLNFSDNSSTTTLGDDLSGNGNDWTTNNFSVTAGAGNDSLVDSPTRYGTDTGAGGEVRGNYATLNALLVGSSTTLNNGNLDSAATADSWNTTFGTIFASSGKWYAEVTVISVSPDYSTQRVGVGFARSTTNLIATASSFLGANTLEGAYYSNGNVYTNSTTNIANATYNTNDVIGVALDMDAGTVTFYKNNSVQPGTFTGLSGLNCIAVSHFGSGAKVVINFGQRPFAYTAPSGAKALVTTNLPEPTIADGGEYFNTVLYTGTGAATLAITGVGFQPDWVWAKKRSQVDSNVTSDVVRGVEKDLFTNTTSAEVANSNGLKSFDADGFTIGSGSGSGVWGGNSGDTYVAWNWKANGAGVSNTDGTITSTVSVSTTSGFSIISYSGNGSSSATVGHGLGVTPSMVIVKSRSNATSWHVWHTSLSSGYNLLLNSTSAQEANSSTSNGGIGTPTSSVITFQSGTLSADNVVGNSRTFVAYCFAPIAGYSAFGSYVGSGSADGPFIYTGFRPAYFLVKRSSDGTEAWFVFDSTRDTYNVTIRRLRPNQDTVEQTDINALDLLSNGFKFRSDAGAWNASGATYIYICFAENPFSIALAR